MLHDHPDAVLESSRLFGNLSRNAEARELMVTYKLDEAFAILVDHNSLDVVKSVCGVLINMTAFEMHRQLILEYNAMEKLLDVVEVADFELQELALKIVHNLSLDKECRVSDELSVHICNVAELVMQHEGGSIVAQKLFDKFCK